MDKFILETSRGFIPEKIGIFNSIEDIHKYLLEEWCISYDEYLKYSPNNSMEDWYDSNEIQISSIKHIVYD